MESTTANMLTACVLVLLPFSCNTHKLWLAKCHLLHSVLLCYFLPAGSV